MDYDDFEIGEIGIKIKNAPSMAKCISIIRKYNPVSMGEIKKNIESDNYVLTCSYISHPGVRKIRKCYDELRKAGIEADLYEDDELTDRELISNLISSHRQTEREVREQVDAEVAADQNGKNCRNAG